MPIRLNGSTSGYTEINNSAVGTNNTITLPGANPTTNGSFLLGATSGQLSFSTDPTLTSLNGGPLAGFRNLLINANPTINQRGYVSGTVTTVANQYTLDRWRVVTSGQKIDFTDSSEYRAVAAPAGGCEQLIEGASVRPGTYTLNWVGTATATVDGNAVSKGGNIALAGGSNVQVRFINGTFALPQLEPGTVATPFERRPIGTELALCQRYFNRIVTGPTGSAVTPTECHLTFPAGVPMRTDPTFSLSAPAKVDWPNNSNFTQSSASISASFGTSNCAYNFLMGNFTGLTVHSRLVLRADGGAVSLSAEL